MIKIYSLPTEKNCASVTVHSTLAQIVANTAYAKAWCILGAARTPGRQDRWPKKEL